MRSLFSIIFFTISISALAQVTADFNLPTEVCLEEQFQLANTSIDGDTYEWDFCGEEFNSLPIESELANIDGATDVKGNYLYYDSISSEYYFFNTNDNGRLFRTNLGSDLSLPYQTTELTFSSGSLDRPQAIKIIKNENDSNFYGYVGSRINGYGISRINFGSDIGNNEVSIDNLGTFGEGNVQIRDIKVYIENGEYFLLGLNLNASRFFLVKYGNSLSNTPYDTITTNSFPNISLSNGFDLVEKDGDIIAFIVGLSSNNIIRLNFGASIETGFVFEKEYDDSDFPSTLNRLSRIKFQEDFGKYYAIVTPFDGGNPTLTIDFKNLHLDSIPTDLQYSNLHFSELSGGYINGDYKYFGVNSQKLFSLTYLSNCGESIKSSTLENPVVSYSIPTSPEIKLKAISDTEEESSSKNSLNVTGDVAPTGDITLDSTYCIADIIEYNFNTTDDIANYLWNFGDGNTSIDASPTHQYATDGKYYISLEVESTAGCRNIFYDTLTILPEPQPEFTTTNTEYCTFEPIAFSNTTPFDFGENVDWSWDFNGEGSSTEESPGFTFESAGTKTITLEANVLGCVQTYQSTLEIIEGPEVGFSYSSNCLGEAIQFTNLSTGANITGYQWDFGNGENSSAENPQVTYNDPGTYAVVLMVSNASGCENTFTQNIQIFEQVVDSIHSTEAIENLPFDLGIDWVNDFDSTQNLTLQWEIGGAIQTTETATYTLDQGTYTINLEITTENNCLFTTQRPIEVKASQKPTPNFNLPAEVCLGEQFELENSSINADSYFWDLCGQEWEDIPSENNIFNSNLISNSKGVKLVEHLTSDADLHLFSTDDLSGNLVRFSISKDFQSINETTSISLTGSQLNRPQSLDIVKDENSTEWVGFIGSRTNGFGISKLNFGTDLLSNTVEVENLGTFNEGNVQFRDLKIIKEGNDYYLMALNLSNERFVIIDYGNSLNNIPQDTIVTSQISGISLANGFDLIEKEGEKIAYVVGLNSNNIVRLNFGSSVTNPFVVEATYSDADFPSTLNRLSDITIEQSFDKYYAIINQFDDGNPTLTIDLKDLHKDSIPEDLNYQNIFLSRLSGGYFEGNYHYFGFNSSDLIKLSYSSNCGESRSFSTDVNPQISYSEPDTYPITLTATHPNGSKASIIKEITVNNNQSPAGNIMLDSTYCIADIIEYNFNTTDDIANYLWNFGDGNTSIDASPTHQYATDGKYYISLEVESTAGCRNIFYDTLTILPEPQPEFTTTNTEYCTFEPIAFSNTTPFDFGENVDWSWDFNGEGSSTEESPGFTFESAGTKTITLEANVLGCVQTYQSTLEIIEGPEVGFSYSSNCLGEAIQFTNLSTGANITGYQWDFGNGENSSAENPQVTYNDPGTYAVVLMVSNASGCENTFTQNIQIFEQVVDSIHSTEAIENMPFDLGIDWVNDFDSTQNLTFQWEIGGAIQTTETATYTLDQGTYTINLEITTENNCLFTTQRPIEVKASQKPTPNFNLPAEVCLGEQFELENSSINADSYFWDLCGQEWEDIPSENNIFNSNLISNSKGVKLVEHLTSDADLHLFSTDDLSGNLVRFSISKDFQSINETTNISLTGSQLNRPQSLDIVKDENSTEWVGFIGSRTNGFGISKLNFGTDLLSNTVEVENLGTFNEGNVQFRDLKIIKEGNDYYLMALNLSNERFVIIDYGNSLNNIPQDTIVTSQISGINLANGFDLIEKEGEKIAYVVGLNSNNIVRLNFGSSVTNPFVVEATYSDADFPSTLNRLSDITIEQSFDKYYAIINQFDDGNPTLTIDLKDLHKDSIPEDLNYQNIFLSRLSGGYFEGNYHYFGFNNSDLIKLSYSSNCGESRSFSTDVNPQISYSEPDTYPITLTATHPNGTQASTTKEITVTNNQAPTISFSTGANLCISSPVEFSLQSEDSLSTYNWDFGDGTFATAENPSHLFSAAGTYAVQLRVMDTAGCRNIFMDSVQVFAEPVPDFQATAQGSLCSQKPTQFENLTNLPTDASFLWDFGDGNTSTEENPEHIYANDGEYIINFQIEMAGCLVEKTDTITVNPGPLVDFSYTDDCFGQVVNFENISTGDFLQGFQWNFGDGTQSTQSNPNHSYDSAGTYNVQLTALTSNGCDFTFQKEVRVNPIASVAFEAEVGCAEQPVQFTEQVALEQSNITDYLWDFGISGTNSDVSTLANPQFTFPVAGTYQVRLQVTTADGCTSTGTQSVSVNALPQPAFTYERNCLFNSILFSPENTNNIIAHFWELQNEAGEVLFTAQSENFSYAFETPGNYQLRYRQQNESLCSNSVTQNVEILPLPEPDFQVGNICAGEAVFFENLTDLKGNTLKNYSWSIDGEIISSDLRPEYTFENSGEYLLSLQVETQSGCIQSVSETINVSPAPIALFELEQTLAAYPYTLSLDAQDYPLEGTELVSWTLNEDTISTTADLNYTIEEAGTYLLGLMVTNEAGCTDSYYKQIRIREPNLDIALNNLRITQDQDFTGFVLNISNRGTLVPERLDLDIDLGSYSVTETIEEPLLPENNRNVALSIKLTAEQLRGLAKICIRAVPHNAAASESNVNNNRVCTNLESGLNIMDIYPNPVGTQFTLPMIIPENGSVNLSLEQSNGQSVKTFSYDLEAGYNEIQIDRDNLGPGMYFLRIRYQGEEKVKKIIFQ